MHVSAVWVHHPKKHGAAVRAFLLVRSCWVRSYSDREASIFGSTRYSSPFKVTQGTAHSGLACYQLLSSSC
jgi:hypothetical protein